MCKEITFLPCPGRTTELLTFQYWFIMTLERHKSKLIPEVDFGGDGRIFVTDRQGTFPLRSKAQSKERGKIQDKEWEGGKKKKESSADGRGRFEDPVNRPWEYDRGERIAGEVGSYHSYDPQRDVKRKYKPKEMSNYERAYREVTGTVSSKSSNSLSRKLKKSKSARLRREYEGRFGISTSEGGSIGSGRKLKLGGTPRRPPDMPLNRRNTPRYSSLDARALQKASRELNTNEFKPYGTSGKMNGYAPGPYYHDYIPRMRKISEETLPFILFIILGILLLICGIVRLLLSYWHIYFSQLWTGFLLLLLGIVGAFHKKDYLNKSKTISYMVIATLGAIATMVTTALILPVLVPCLQYIARDSNLTSTLPDYVNFTNWNKTLVSSASLSTETMVYITVSTDLVGLLFVCIGFASLTVMLMALDNYWEASHVTTGECDHKGNPRFFNPLEQMSLAQATIFIGIVTLNLQTPEFATYLSTFWAPFLLLLAGLSALCFGKRPDLSGLGTVSTLMQLVAMLASGVATVLVTLGLVESITTLTNDDKLKDYHKNEVIISASANALFILIMIVNIVFSVGVVFRHIRKMCCVDCFEDYLGPYGKQDGSIDVRL